MADSLARHPSGHTPAAVLHPIVSASFPHLTVLDDITLAPRHVRTLPKREAMALAMAERVRIPEQARKYPVQLSGGQQQRVAIARSLARSG